MPASPSTPQPISSAARKLPRDLAIGLILASLLAAALLHAQPSDPPPNLARLVAHRETETAAERDEYTYRQSFTLQELDDHGAARGEYKEVRDITFSPTHERSEELIGKTTDSLKFLKLTEEDFRDIREIQPLTLSEEQLWNYDTKTRGDETMDGQDCWVLQIKPRQIFEGQRYFDGLLWVDKKGYNIVRLEGRAVPQLYTRGQENLFPRFTTVRKPIDGKHWFATITNADDTLDFRNGPQREKLTIAYTNYKRFSATSTFTVK
ncbi:MAG TPA: hypothetical protein VHW09_21115 [Bryobacteraceae bacterium]|jgi:hypothetical protein|nr:hypothetical protein [Bryobacteraceae bacterium]